MKILNVFLMVLVFGVSATAQISDPKPPATPSKDLEKFQSALDSVLSLNAKGQAALAEKAIQQIKKTWPKGPSDKELGYRALVVFGQKLDTMVPVPMDLKKSMGLVAADWAMKENLQEPGGLDLAGFVADHLSRTGQLPVIEKVLLRLEPEAFTRDFEWTMRVSAPLCFYWRQTNRIEKCEAWLDDMEKIGREKKASLSELTIQRVHVLMDKNKLAEAKEALNSVIRSKDEQEKVWAYFILAVINEKMGQFDEMAKNLALHEKQMEKNRTTPVPYFDKVPKMMVEISALIKQRKIAEAKTQNQTVDELTKKNERGLGNGAILVAYNKLVIASIEKDKKNIVKYTAELKKMASNFPKFQHFEMYADLLAKASAGQLKETELATLKKKVGPETATVKDFEDKLEAVRGIKR